MDHDSARLGANGLPGIGFTTASCSAEYTMYGVMIPGISAGSNQVGASETCTPQASCPSELELCATPGAAIAKARARTAQMLAWRRRPRFAACFVDWKEADEHVGASPTCEVGMAFPLRTRRERRSFQPQWY